MRVETGAKINNKFKIVMRNAEKGETIQEGKAENIVLNRCWERVCNFNPYFTNIVYGTGTGEVSPTRTTLFNRLGHKLAAEESLIIGNPTSAWTKMITIGTEEHNGAKLTEIGISETTTNINTHALITDAEGNLLEMEEKTNLMIIDIYATVFISIYDIDDGVFFYHNALRDYLTGGATIGNVLEISYGVNDDNAARITGTRVVNTTEKSVKVSGKFNVGDLNKDVNFISWTSLGLRCRLPRVGVFTGRQVSGKEIGVGDGVKTSFFIPNSEIENLVMYIDATPNPNWTYNYLTSMVTFDSPVPDTLIVTADYLSKLIPKTVDNVVNVSFKIKYDVGEPSPVIADIDYSTVPGAQEPIGGNKRYGFFGEVPAVDFITGEALCAYLGLTAGTLQHSDEAWLKFANRGSQHLVPKKTFRHTVSWDDINAVGAVWGRLIELNGALYLIRLLSTTEWNELMYPVHVDFGQWAQYTDAELLVRSNAGSGSFSWTSTPSGSDRIGRGYSGVTVSNYNTPSYAIPSIGFRPVLTFLRAL